MTEAINTRICVIGAGPSGMNFLCSMKEAELKGNAVPEIVCYEKQSDWGGLWNFTWRTGTDENGEQCHGGMYHSLWSNSPKECLEFPDYTFEEHFKKNIPSYPPREVLLDYLKGYWSRFDVRSTIKFNHVVRHVTYSSERGLYSVETFDFTNNRLLQPELFTHLIVANGHFSVPHQPEFPGFAQFPGRIMHSHDFRDFQEFKNRRVLVIGASYSAEDLALQCIKFGAKSVICTWRTQPLNFKWPAGIEERPLLQRLECQTAHFKDGSSADLDSIILCTGYYHSFPFLPEELRLKTKNTLYPENLYRGVLSTNSENNRLFYLGMQDQYYSFTLFYIEAMWARDVILGSIKLPEQAAMLADNAKWKELLEKCPNDCMAHIKFQTEHMKQLCEDTKCPHNLDASQIFFDWEHLKIKEVASYHNGQHVSIYTNNLSPPPKKPFMEAMDDSMKEYLK